MDPSSAASVIPGQISASSSPSISIYHPLLLSVSAFFSLFLLSFKLCLCLPMSLCLFMNMHIPGFISLLLCQKWILCIGGRFEELWEGAGYLDQDCGKICSGFSQQKHFCPLGCNFAFGVGPLNYFLNVNMATCFQGATGHWMVDYSSMLLFITKHVTVPCTVMSGS